MQIFSLLMQLFMGHIVSSLHILKERIFFFKWILIFFFFFFFKFGLCLFIYPHLLNFPLNCFFQNLFCFSFFYRGGSLSLIFVVHRRELLLFIKGVASIFYRVQLFFFFFPLVLFFLSCLLSLYSLFELSLSIRDKKGEK